MDGVCQEDDNMSMTSESSIGSDMVAAPAGGVGHAIPARRRQRRQADNQLGPVQWNLQRLRARH